MYKLTDRDKLMMCETWDKKLELKTETSEYYAIMVQKLGKGMADYYWNRRYSYEHERDIVNWRKVCKEINEKCDVFLKSRGVDVNINNYFIRQ